MQKLLSCFCFLMLTDSCMAQVHGKVFDAETKLPIRDVNVFLSGTLLSSRTDSSGKFIIKHAGPGKFDLVVTMIGYQTANRQISGTDTTAFIFFLSQKNNELANVVVTSKTKNNWKKWGDIFTKTFIGSAPTSRYCRIINYDKIRFKKEKDNDVLSAYCSEPIIIENKALGYLLKYKMETFSIDMQHSLLQYTGYAYFEEMQGNESEVKKWQKNRHDEYEGSILHFMRALYYNKLETEGFEIKQQSQRTGEPLSDKVFFASHNIKRDEIVSALDSVSMAFHFSDYLNVVYTRKSEPSEYFSQTGLKQEAAAYTSDLTIKPGKIITVERNGAYINPKDLVVYGYWAWSQNLGSLLPFDYVPD